MLANEHCMKSVRIRSYPCQYSVLMRENTDQNNSEYGHFLRRGIHERLFTETHQASVNCYGFESEG